MRMEDLLTVHKSLYLRLLPLQRETNYEMGRWCSGNTTVFGTVVGGSIPSRPAIGRQAWSKELAEKLIFFIIRRNREVME